MRGEEIMADYSNVSFKNNGKLKLLIIVGTRPEIIRLAAVINKTRKYFDVILAHTGQNYDYNLNGVFFHDLQLADPEVYMNAVGADLGETMGNIIAESYKLMVAIQPDAVLVLGDTNSCLSVIGAKRLHEPFGFSLLLSFLAMFFYLYAYEPAAAGKGWKSAIVTWYQKFKESVFFRKLFLLLFVTSMILFRTLLNRNLWMNPLSKVMGGWGIWETVNGEQKLTTECIENVIMMVPFSSVVMWTFKEKTGNGWKKILWYSGKVAFIFSVSIEMLQLLLRLGTFQLSDIFYNTVGGVLGGLVYYVTMKARKHL